MALVVALLSLAGIARAQSTNGTPATVSTLRPRLGIITLMGHDFIQVKPPTGEPVKYLVTNNSQIGTPENPLSIAAFRIGNQVTLTAQPGDKEMEIFELFPGDERIYFMNPKRPQRAPGDTPVRAGNIMLIQKDRLVLRTTGSFDFEYALTPKTQFGDKATPRKASYFRAGNMVKILGRQDPEGNLAATQVIPFLRDVGSRHQAKSPLEIPETMNPIPECSGWIVVVTEVRVEIRTKSGQLFGYLLTPDTRFGTPMDSSSPGQFKPGNFVKINAVKTAEGSFEVKRIALADYRK